jgi:type I restriction enzyme S subunit
MKHWPTKPLSEFAEVIRGVSFDKSQVFDSPGENLVPILRAGNIQDSLLTDSDLVFVPAHLVSQEQRMRRGDLAVCMSSGSPAIVGKSAHLETDWGGSVGAFCAIVRFGEKLNHRLGSYWFRSPSFMQWRDNNAKGANIQNLRRTELEKLPIPVPPMAEQERIVKLLDEADELRKLRTQADRRTADLIPSLFHDMFGPDAPGSATWQTATVAELAAAHEGSIRTGPFGSDLRHSEFVEEGVPVLGIDNVVENEFRWTKSRCIPEAKFAEMKKFVVFPGDLLVTIMGTVGKCSIAPEELPVCISTKHLCTVTLDRTKAHPRFIWGAFLHDASVTQQTRSVGKGAIMEGWNSTIIKRLRLRVPPLSLQKEFAARVSEIRALQAEQAASRRRLDDLFQSMLHRAFQGEL